MADKETNHERWSEVTRAGDSDPPPLSSPHTMETEIKGS